MMKNNKKTFSTTQQGIKINERRILLKNYYFFLFKKKINNIQ